MGQAGGWMPSWQPVSSSPFHFSPLLSASHQHLLPPPAIQVQASMPRRPPVLEEEHVEEILLRFPADQPAGLFRAALVCKRWCRLITSPAFRRRYREFHHRTPPMLALLVNGEADSDGSSVSRSVPRAAFCLPRFETRSWRVLDARHGRILLRRVGGREPPAAGVQLLVCDPITKEVRMVPVPSPRVLCLAAAVLCSVRASATPDVVGACSHLDCSHHGPFLLVFVGCLHLDTTRRTFIYTYSSETATWNGPISTWFSLGTTPRMASMCVWNALYFGFPMSNTILKYDLQSGQIDARIEFPTECSFNQSNVFITTKDGGLGIATIHHHVLHTWSWDDAVGWMQTRAIELQRLLPGDALLGSAEPHVTGFADGFGVVFLFVNNWLYTLHLSTCKVVKLFRGMGISISSVVPYMSFCTPAF